MRQQPKEQKRGRGRPPVKDWPGRIPDMPENIAKALMRTPPKKTGDWKHMRISNDNT